MCKAWAVDTPRADPFLWTTHDAFDPVCLLGPVDDEERTRIAGMGNDELERYEGELFEKLADRLPADDSTPSP